MNKIKEFISEHNLIPAIMLLAACARFIKLGSLPNGVMADETYNAYNTWSIMTEGIDSRGYRLPVYFVAWGSGMNALYAYLALPLFRIFGASITVFRLPQALASLGSVFAFYVLGREVFDKKTGYFMAFALAVNPWSIMTARFGLESTLAPAMILFSLTFLVLGIKKHPNYLPAASFFMALSLYSYSLSWIALPIILILTFFLYRKRIPFKPVTFISAALLLIAAMPLLLFIAVNLNYIPEIITPFFSIPKLAVFRGGEFNYRHLFENVRTVLEVIVYQYDGHEHTSSPLVGAYYLFTTPFFILGIAVHFVKMLKNYRSGDNDLQYLFPIWLISAAVVALLQEAVNFVHLNLIHIPLVFYGVYGITQTARHIKSRLLVPACLIFYIISFSIFFYDYSMAQEAHSYNDLTAEAIEKAKDLAGSGRTITIVEYPTIQSGIWMWLEKPNPVDFYESVVYIDDPAWGQIGSYGQFHWVNSIDRITGEDVYITPNNSAYRELLTDMGFNIIEVNERYIIADSKGFLSTVP